MISRRTLLAGSLAAGAGPRLLRRAVAAEPIRMLLWWDYVGPEDIERYREQTGGDLFIRGIGANDEIFTFLRAGRNRYSVISPHQGLIGLLHELDLIQPINPAKLPHLSEIDPRFNDDRWFLIDGERYGVPLAYGSSPLVYNAATLPTPPAEWRDLLSPDYIGKLAMIDDGLGHLMHWSHALGFPDPSELTRDHLTELLAQLTVMKRSQVRLFTDSLGEMATALVRGEVLATTTGWEGLPLVEEAQGGDLRLAHPLPGDYGYIHALCIPADAPDVAGAHRFIDFMLQAEQQASLANRVKRAVINQEAVPLLAEPVRALYNYADLDAMLSLSPVLSFPPMTSPDGVATYLDWIQGWERIRLVKSKYASPTPTPG
jgi:spermidine/putrescine transport system substrate-binding protein